jgi:type I restriction enzyme S subunit
MRQVDKFSEIKVAVPPLPEQETIIKQIAVETAEINEVTERTQREIELIREYRTRLIADVVTGKLDVRGVALPEGDEAGLEDDATDAEEDETEGLEAGEEVE